MEHGNSKKENKLEERKPMRLKNLPSYETDKQARDESKKICV